MGQRSNHRLYDLGSVTQTAGWRGAHLEVSVEVGDVHICANVHDLLVGVAGP